MGQAKQRGTFEQRQHAAFDMIDRNYSAAQEATEKLDAEEDSAKKLLGMLIMDTLERFDKSGHVLLNADFSQLESKMFSRNMPTWGLNTGRPETVPAIQGMQIDTMYIDEHVYADKGN